MTEFAPVSMPYRRNLEAGAPSHDGAEMPQGDRSAAVSRETHFDPPYRQPAVQLVELRQKHLADGIRDAAKALAELVTSAAQSGLVVTLRMRNSARLMEAVEQTWNPYLGPSDGVMELCTITPRVVRPEVEL